MKKKSIQILLIFSIQLPAIILALIIPILSVGWAAIETYTWPNGDKYTGEWKNDVKHGKGTYIYANGNKYVGEYKDGKKHGYGTFYFGEFKYEGKWVDDKPVTDGEGPHAAYGHYLWGEEYGQKQQYSQALIEYSRALSKSHDKWIAFSCYNNMGIIYLHMGNDEKSSECFNNAVDSWSAIAYYPYMGLASLAYKNGKIEECAGYRQKAYDLVNGKDYEKLEAIYTGYDPDTLKKWVTIFYDSSQIQMNFLKLKYEHSRKNYEEVERLATEMLNRKYHAGLGISTEGTYVSSVSEESIAALNGMVEGDQLLEINNIKISDPRTAITELANLYDRFGEKINVKIKRKNREITMLCHLYYPELETANQFLSEAKEAIASGKFDLTGKDIDPPKINVIKPERKRGISKTSKKSILFEFLAGDNIGLKEVTIDGQICDPVEMSLLERSLFQGEVKKYSAIVTVREGSNIYSIKAIDTSDNITTKEISIIQDPSYVRPFEGLYQNSVAVLIGINNYPNWPSLEFAVNDANSMKEKLQNVGFNNIIELYNNDATRLNILRLLGDTLPKILGKDDRLLVYFAGHGQTETFQYLDKGFQLIDEKEGYIIPIDGEMTNYPGTAISMSAIRKASANYKAKHILFVFDSCYSGLGLKRAGGLEKGDDYIEKIASMASVQIITAGGENEQVGEEKGHGIFTGQFLVALDGEADLDKDEFITASEIGAYIRPIVTRKTQNAQTPRYGWISGEGDFIFEMQD